MLGVILQRLQIQPVRLQLALEIRLRQRRPLIGRRGLIAHQNDFALETAQPQRIRRLPTRLPGADDHNSLRRSRHDADLLENRAVISRCSRWNRATIQPDKAVRRLPIVRPLSGVQTTPR